MRMISGLKGKTYQDRCREVGLETLERRREKQDMAEVYRMLNGGELETNILPLTGVRAGARTRRAADHTSLQKQYARTDPRKYSFGVRVMDKWNSLSQETRESKDRKAFKARLNMEWR